MSPDDKSLKTAARETCPARRGGAWNGRKDVAPVPSPAMITSFFSPRIGRTYPGPPPEVVGLVKTKYLLQDIFFNSFFRIFSYTPSFFYIFQGFIHLHIKFKKHYINV